MKMDLTKDEYVLLLDLIYLGDWLMHSNDAEHQENAYRSVRKKILSYHQAMDVDQVKYDPAYDDYFETQEYEMRMQDDYIIPYDNEAFWEELVERLSARDVMNHMGFLEFETMSPIERLEAIEEATELYANEFQSHGLENLKISYRKEMIN
jgi:hypothetical protein